MKSKRWGIFIAVVGFAGLGCHKRRKKWALQKWREMSWSSGFFQVQSPLLRSNDIASSLLVEKVRNGE